MFQFNPSVGLVIEVQSLKVEIYQALLRIYAQFSGIRYLFVFSSWLMFNINLIKLVCKIQYVLLLNT